jgi:hypothetical protein
VIQYRRLAALLLGAWLGAGVLVDIAVTQNFQTVDRFLAKPGAVQTAVDLNHIGRAKAREILRRNAGEENNFLFEQWEWTELLLIPGLFCLLFFGGRPQKIMLAGTGALELIVCVQRFWLSPTVAEMGRKLADLGPKDPLNATFWQFHGAYSGIEILKLLIGLAMAARLAVRRGADPDYFAREFEKRAAAASAPTSGRQA